MKSNKQTESRKEKQLKNILNFGRPSTGIRLDEMKYISERKVKLYIEEDELINLGSLV